MTEPQPWQSPGSGSGSQPAAGQPGSSPGWDSSPGSSPGWGSPPPGPGWAPPPGWSPAPPPVQPGVVPLRPLGTGEILDGAFRVVRRQPRTTLGLAAVVTLVQLAITLLVRLATGGSVVTSVPVQNGVIFSGVYTVATLVSLLVAAAVGAVLTALITVVAAEAVLGRTTSAGAAWRRVRPLLWPVVAVGLITSIAQDLGLILLLIPGIFLWGAWALALPALVLERTGVRGALRRSWRLAVPDWWRVWWIRALSALLAFVVTWIILLPTLVYGGIALFHSRGTGTIGVGPTVVATVASAAASILVTPFLAGVLTLLYVDRRMRSEGLDLTLARSVQG